ncbi:MAG TPA: PH domain-containing protein [Polyangia bacterium]|nr:PH domain-containing protein [Polyangia bacterium]
MPLITCPDCGHQVSTSAAVCPQCNRPMSPQLASPTAAAPAAEQVVWEGVPSLKALLVEIVTTAVYAVVLPIAAVLAFDPVLSLVGGLGTATANLVAESRPTIKLAVIGAVALVVGARLAKLAWHVAVLRSHRYRISNQRIVVETGAFGKRIDEIDMRTVEDIEFQQRFLERLLGIGQIAIVAADKQMSRFRLLGIENPRELRELIRAKAFQATQGQLFTRGT